MSNIAAISNKKGNVMAMMPHPERTTNGDAIFRSMRDFIAEGQLNETIPLYYYPRQTKMPRYQSPADAQECIVELMITDNQALTVQNTLRRLGFPVTVRRQIHWEIGTGNADVLQQIKKSGVLFNERKEIELSTTEVKANAGAAFLVRAKEDLIGQQRLQTLKDHFNIQGLNGIQHSVLWHFSAENANIADLSEQILRTNIIQNPYAHDCYQYC